MTTTIKIAVTAALLAVILFPNSVTYNNKDCSGYLFNSVLMCENL